MILNFDIVYPSILLSFESEPEGSSLRVEDRMLSNVEAEFRIWDLEFGL